MSTLTTPSQQVVLWSQQAAQVYSLVVTNLLSMCCECRPKPTFTDIEHAEQDTNSSYSHLECKAIKL